VLTNDVVLDHHDTGLAHAIVTVTLFGCPEPALPDGVQPATDWWT
jgi:hypothetical protein